MAADALRQSAYTASGLKEAKETTCPRRSANTRPTTAGRRCTPLFRKGQSGNPGGRSKKNLQALLADALNEPVFVTVNGRRRKITKREAVIHQLVNKSTSADLRATKMLIDMMREVEQKAGMTPQPAPEAPRLGPADEKVIKNLLEGIRQDILADIDAQKAHESGSEET